MRNKPDYKLNWWDANDDHPLEAKRYYYFSLYIGDKTKRPNISHKQLRYVWCTRDEVFFVLLNQWNSNIPDLWKYWSEISI